MSTVLVLPAQATSEETEIEDYQWNQISGEGLYKDPTALKMLEKIETSKEILAELQNPTTQIQITEHQMFIEEQRKISQANLQEQLDRMNKRYADFTPHAAYAKFVAKKPAELQDFYWSLFNYLYNKVEIAREHRDRALDAGGSYQDAQKIFIEYAKITKAEKARVFNEMVQKHGIVHQISNMDDLSGLPVETQNEYAKYMGQQKFQTYEQPTALPLASSSDGPTALPLASSSDGPTPVKLASLTSSNNVDDEKEQVSNNQEPTQNLSNDNLMNFNGESFTVADDDSMDNVSEFSLSVWIKPDYSEGSSELTIASKESAFSLSIKNNKLTEQVAKFSVFDGIKWTTIESSSPIPEEWTHIAATLDGSNISMYINGKLEATNQIMGNPILNSYGYLESKSVNGISSDNEILIGAKQTTTRGDTKSMGFFSGSVDEIIIEDKLFNEQKITELCENSQYFSV